MNRRRFLAIGGLPAIWPNGALAVRPNRIDHSVTDRFGPTHDFDLLWYEDQDGNKLLVDMKGCYDPPQGSRYQVSRFPCTLHTDYLGLKEDGSSYQVMRGSHGWCDDLVLALVVKGGYRLRNAIIIAASACERCINSLAYACGLPWGYAEGSDEWRESNTSCELCEAEARST